LKIVDHRSVVKCNGAGGTPTLHSGGRGMVGFAGLILDVCVGDVHS